jgi:hypothetical protein
MVKAYYKASRYAYVLDSTDYRDLVHNAYLYYYKKSNGKNLFEEHEGFILRCVKWMWQWKYNVRKEFVEFNEQAINYTTPHLLVESEQQVKIVYDKVGSYHSGKNNRSLDSKLLLTTLTLLNNGYSQGEIAEQLDTSPQVVSGYVKKIRTIVA